MQVQLRLHKLLDEDDADRDMYASALQADIDDVAMPGIYAARRAAEVLNDPDPAARQWVRLFPLNDDVCRCICLGLIPTGAWSAMATRTVHSPRIAPEVRGMLGALGESFPRMASLGDAVHSISTHSRMARVLKVEFQLCGQH